MPWQTPTLRETRRLTRDYVLSQLGAKAMIPNSVLRIMSDAMSGLAHLTMLYIDWLSKQLLPDTAETEWLDRHGQIWLVNADGSKGRKAATYANGDIQYEGTPEIIIPVGTLLNATNGVQYQTVTEALIGLNNIGVSEAVALTAGAIGNLPEGTAVNPLNPITGVNFTTLLGDMTGGVDDETDDQLRERILFRIQNPPMGGSQADYVRWTMSVPGVTRAWAASEMGPGTITVRFMMDVLRANIGGFPLQDDIDDVEAYLNTVRPVTVMDNFVLSPIPRPIDFRVENLLPDTEAVRANVEASIQEMILRSSAPGQTIYAAWKYQAIMSAPGVQSCHLQNGEDDVMESAGHIGVFGDILFLSNFPAVPAP